MSNRIEKLSTGLILVGSYFLLPEYGFTFDCPLLNHFLYPFCHANIWHLLCNILCLLMVKCPTHIFVSFSIAILCSFVPCFASEPTMGFSGVLFAMVGISWGKVHRFKDMVRRNKWILFIPAFFPHVNFLIHLYCLMAGYLYGRYATGD